MSKGEIKRVRYFDRQFLRTVEFSDEQAYHLAMRRRHNISHHSWGIVSGLQLVEQDEVFFVEPGMAVDGYGREVILPHRRGIPADAFIEHDSDQLDVWLLYGLQPSDAINSTLSGCNGYRQPTRDREYPRIDVRVPGPASARRREPPDLAESELLFDATGLPPDNARETWPVFLGQIIREPLDPERLEFDYRANQADRPYVGLRGERVEAPSGRATMQLGAESPNSPFRFAVSVADPKIDAKTSQADQSTTDSKVAETRIFVDAQNDVGIRGDTTVHGDLTIAGGHGIRFPDQPALPLANKDSANDKPVEDVKPWQIYHRSAEPPADSDGTSAPSDQEDATNSVDGNDDIRNPVNDEPNDITVLDHELRIVMDGRPSIPAAANFPNEVVIGATDDEGFKPGLTIRQNGDVIVHGNLKVNGNLEARGGTSDDTLEPATRQLLASLFQSALTAAGASLTEQLAAVERLLASPQGEIIAAQKLTQDARPELARQLRIPESTALVELLRLLVGDKLKRDLVAILGKDATDEARKVVTGAVAEVGNHPDAQPPFSRVVGANPVFREGFVRIVLDTDGLKEIMLLAHVPETDFGREKLAQSIVDFRKALTPATDPRWEHMRNDVVGDVSRLPTFVELVHTVDGLRAIGELMPSDDVGREREAFVIGMLANSTNSTPHVRFQQFVAFLVNTIEMRQAVAQSVALYQANLGNLIKNLLDESTGPKAIVDAVFDNPNGISAFAPSLRSSENTRHTVIGGFAMLDQEDKVFNAFATTFASDVTDVGNEVPDGDKVKFRKRLEAVGKAIIDGAAKIKTP